MKAVVVIPAHNEAATLPDVVRGSAAHAPVIVVDDGSTDGTVEALADLPVTLLRNDRNRGKAASLWRGFQRALADGAEWVVTLDGDGQHAPEDIPRLLQEAEAYPDRIIIGARVREREQMPPLRRFGNGMANFWIAWASGQPLADSQSGFRVYPASLLSALAIPVDRRSGFVFESEVLIEGAWRGHPAAMAPVAACYPEAARPSHYRPTADTLAIIAMVAGRLLRRGLHPLGLYRSLKGRPVGLS